MKTIQDIDSSDSFSSEDEALIQEFISQGGGKSGYAPLDQFITPIEMIEFYDDSFHSGIRSLHPWQKEMLEFVAQPIFTFEEHLQFTLCAANGSGKDAYFICPIIIWLLLTQIRHKIITTSASYTQLTSQTEAYVRSFAEIVNNKNKEIGLIEKTFIIKKEDMFCLLTGATCKMFSTDDPGRAEGHHPWPDYPKAEETIIVNELKTVEDTIVDHLEKCTYNRWLGVSSPGKMGGKLYKHYISSVLYPAPYEPGKRYARKITSFDCPHKTIKSILQDRAELGENSPLYRSKHLAEFTSIDEQVVISREDLDKCLQFAKTKHNLNIGRHAGLDLAKGGDENTLYVFDENIFLDKMVFRSTDTTITVDVLIEAFKKFRLSATNINADEGHVGGAIIDNLSKQGWPVNRIVNQSAPLGLAQHLGNRGAELWFSFARLIQENIVVLPKDDEKLMSQLSSRYYTQHKSNGRIILESKADARAKGHGSPDRADAVVLAFAGISIDRYLDFSTPVEILPDKSKLNSEEKLKEYISNIAYGKIRRGEPTSETLVNGSLNVLIDSKKSNNNFGEFV